MSDKKIIGDQRVKDIKEVMIQSTTSDFWDFTKGENAACQKNDSPLCLIC